MAFFSGSKNDLNYSALVDIGSGSVLVTIIGSDPGKAHPDIIWSKREYTALQNIDSISQSAKNVMSSLLNAMMILDSEGRKALKEAVGISKLDFVQVTIAAPWSYTVTKTISYKHDEPFNVSPDLVEELLRTSHKKVEEELSENEKANNLGLSVVTRSCVGIIANGYPVTQPSNQKAKSLKIVESSAVAQNYLLDALEEVQHKVLPGSKSSLYSFMLIYYYLIKSLYPDTQEYCLVDITYEATEVGIVRDGILNYSTHTPYGAYSLAREISNILQIPLTEAFGHLHDENLNLDNLTLTAGQKKDIEILLNSYTDKISALFHETGDALSVPKKIFLHGNLETEAFFKEQISVAAKKATGLSHAVYPVSTVLLTRHYSEADKSHFMENASDTALLISAQFFHNREFHSKFEQL
ncbi:MAG: hypothetical protein R3B53_03995 [Candidatus Paceibacterota bacterium]